MRMKTLPAPLPMALVTADRPVIHKSPAPAEKVLEEGVSVTGDPAPGSLNWVPVTRAPFCSLYLQIHLAGIFYASVNLADN